MVSPLSIEQHPTLPELLTAAAQRFVELVETIHRDPVGGRNGDGSARIVLTGGTAGIKFLEKIAAVPDLDWSRIHVFFGDERNVPVDDPESNEGQAREALLNKVAIPEKNIHGYGLTGEDMEQAASRYASLLTREAPEGFDLHLLGMGGEGHINSLFPHTPAIAETEQLVVTVYDSPKPPAQRVSLTLPAIHNASQVWFLVSGSEKAEAAHQIAQQGDPNEWPAAGAHGAESTVLFVTDDTASLI